MKKNEAKLKTSKGELIQLENLSFRIGSFEGVCNYVLKDERVSPIHGVIENKENNWYLQDTNSAAGIIVNGEKIEPNKPILLNQNDCIMIADIKFSFMMDLELFKESDVRLINDLYKKWLLEVNESIQKGYQKEILYIVTEKINGIGIEEIGIKKSNKDKRKDPLEESETEVLSESEGNMPTTVLNDIEGEESTTVLNPETGDITTIALTEEEGSMVTTVLSEEGSEDTMVLSDETESLDIENSDTTLLNDSEDDETDCETAVLFEELHCVLERVNSKEGKIDIDKLPFIIGKTMSQVDYCLNERGISRSQAKIFMETDDSYYIADMESKNGTYINGKRIYKDTAVKMNDGDMVSFAEYNYIVTIK